MAFEMASVLTFIEGLSVNATMPDGSSKAVTMLNYFNLAAKLPDEITPRLCPCFYCDPNKQVQVQTVQRDSFGNGSTAKQTLVYSLPFVFLYAPVGSDRRLSTILPGLLASAKAIAGAILANDKPPDPSVDLFFDNFTLLGSTLPDVGYNPEAQTGGLFHGFPMVLKVMEFIN